MMADVGIINECMILECPENHSGECLGIPDVTLSGMCSIYEAWADGGTWPESEKGTTLRCDRCNYTEFWSGPPPTSKKCTNVIISYPHIQHQCFGTMKPEEATE